VSNVVKKGKTTVLDGEEAKKLLDKHRHIDDRRPAPDRPQRQGQPSASAEIRPVRSDDHLRRFIAVSASSSEKFGIS
jgi:hypothetical protein